VTAVDRGGSDGAAVISAVVATPDVAAAAAAFRERVAVAKGDS